MLKVRLDAVPEISRLSPRRNPLFRGGAELCPGAPPATPPNDPDPSRSAARAESGCFRRRRSFARRRPMPRDRSGAPIRRHSLESGTFERRWYRPVSSADRHKIEVAAEIHDRRTKTAGRHGGEVGGVRGLKLLSLMLGLQLASPFGQLNPSIQWLAAKTRYSTDTIVRKLAALREAGLLAWHRRMKPSLDPDAEWRWRQDSNAYRILVPAWLAAALPVVMSPPAPGSEDMEHAAAMASADLAAHVATLRPGARVEFTREATAEPSPLDASLARWAALVERESQPSRDSGIRGQSPTRSDLPRRCRTGLSAGNSAHGGPPNGGNQLRGIASGEKVGRQPPFVAPRTG